MSIISEIPNLIDDLHTGNLSVPEAIKKYGEHQGLTKSIIYNYCKKNKITLKRAIPNSRPQIDKIPGLVDDIKARLLTVPEMVVKYSLEYPTLAADKLYTYYRSHGLEVFKKVDKIVQSIEIPGLVDDLESGDLCIQDVLEKYQPGQPDLTYSRLWNFVQKNGLNPRKRRQFFNEDFFFAWTPELAYILGWLVSDGYIFDSNGIGITILKKDAEVLEDMKEIIEFKKPIRYASKLRNREGKYKEGETYLQEIAEMRIFSPRVCEHLAAFGLVQNKTDTIGWIKQIPEEFSHHFIRGVFDGDGTVFASVGGLYFSITGNKDLLEEVQKHINQIAPAGIKGCLQRGNGRQCWQLTYSGTKSMNAIFHYMYKDSTPKTRLRRKYLRFVDWLYRHAKTVIFEDESVF